MPETPIRKAEKQDLQTIVRLLNAVELPTDDVRELGPAAFLVAVTDVGIVGAVGVELYEGVALLRSLAVGEAARGTGLGTRLTEAAEAQARKHGADAVYLLTTTAAPFFRARGYRDIPREAAPAPITQTREYAELCPASAELLEKRLEADEAAG